MRPAHPVFALTQSVGRVRGWAVKITVSAVPLGLALLGLGFLAQWFDESYWLTGPSPLANIDFGVHGIIPAATGLHAAAIASRVGIIVRSATAADAAALVAAGAGVVLLLVPLREHLVSVARDITPIADATGGTGVAVYTGAPEPND